MAIPTLKTKKRVTDEKLAAAKLVFGEDVQFDENGNPIENGIGSIDNVTPHHLEALKKEADAKAKADADRTIQELTIKALQAGK